MNRYSKRIGQYRTKTNSIEKKIVFIRRNKNKENLLYTLPSELKIPSLVLRKRCPLCKLHLNSILLLQNRKIRKTCFTWNLATERIIKENDLIKRTVQGYQQKQTCDNKKTLDVFIVSKSTRPQGNKKEDYRQCKERGVTKANNTEEEKKTQYLSENIK